MGIIDQKKDVFGNIAALNVLNGGLPKLPDFNSFSSISNSTNSAQFLIDLLNSLVGFEALKEFVVDTISFKLPQIETSVKDGIKKELKELVSCSVNPSIPDWFKHGESGVEMKVTDLDFFNIMKVNPESLEGSLIYKNVPPGVNSQDFNTYLYYTIQNNGTPENWGQSTLNADILETTFLETSTTVNNVLKFTTSATYIDKTLTNFNNDFIDSITMFGAPNTLDSTIMINMIFEELFGAISSSPSINKSKKQLKLEAEFKHVLDCVLDSEDDIISDNFFTFDNPTLAKIDEEVNNKKNGISFIKTCGNIPTSITSSDLNDVQNAINDTTVNNVSNKQEESKAILQSLDNLADTQASFSNNPQDILTIKTDFFTEIIKKLTRIIMSLVISPKFITLFAINHRIIYGQTNGYNGAVDFIKKNRKLVKSVAEIIRNIILELLLSLVLKILMEKLSQKFIDDGIEKAKNYVSIILSYLSVPPEIIALIRKR